MKTTKRNTILSLVTALFFALLCFLPFSSATHTYAMADDYDYDTFYYFSDSSHRDTYRTYLINNSPYNDCILQDYSYGGFIDRLEQDYINGFFDYISDTHVIFEMIGRIPKEVRQTEYDLPETTELFKDVFQTLKANGCKIMLI